MTYFMYITLHCHVTYSKIFIIIDQNVVYWKSSYLTKGTVMDPNYSLPPNVALITLEVGLITSRLATVLFTHTHTQRP